MTASAQTGEVSRERLDVLDQDVLVVLGADRATAQDDPLFAGLAVVREDRTVYAGPFDGDVPAALGSTSPLSLP